LVTGRPPFQADNPLDTLMQVLEREPVSPRILNPKVPQDLDTICLKCLEKERRRRYGTANDFVEELQRFLDGRPILARPISRPARAWRWCRRNPVIESLTALVFVSLIAGTVISTYFAIEAYNRAVGETAQRQEAERQTEVANKERNRADDEAAEARRLANLANTRLYAFRLGKKTGIRKSARRLEWQRNWRSECLISTLTSSFERMIRRVAGTFSLCPSIGRQSSIFINRGTRWRSPASMLKFGST